VCSITEIRILENKKTNPAAWLVFCHSDRRRCTHWRSGGISFEIEEIPPLREVVYPLYSGDSGRNDN